MLFFLQLCKQECLKYYPILKAVQQRNKQKKTGRKTSLNVSSAVGLFFELLSAEQVKSKTPAVSYVNQLFLWYVVNNYSTNVR